MSLLSIRLDRLAAGLLLATALTPAFAADNPMSLAGEQHNQYLACLAEHGRPGVSPLVTLVRSCGVEPGMPIHQFVATYQPLVDGDPTIPLAVKMEPFRSQYTDYEFGFFHRIDAVLETADSEEKAGAMFAELEEEAIKNLDVRTLAGQTVLGALSVSRHSLHYWTRVEPIPDQDGTGKVNWPRLWKLLAVVVADAAGYCLTASLGPAAAPLAGPVSSAVSSAVKDAF